MGLRSIFLGRSAVVSLDDVYFELWVVVVVSYELASCFTANHQLLGSYFAYCLGKSRGWYYARSRPGALLRIKDFAKFLCIGWSTYTVVVVWLVL